MNTNYYDRCLLYVLISTVWYNYQVINAMYYIYIYFTVLLMLEICSFQSNVIKWIYLLIDKSILTHTKKQNMSIKLQQWTFPELTKLTELHDIMSSLKQDTTTLTVYLLRGATYI